MNAKVKKEKYMKKMKILWAVTASLCCIVASSQAALILNGDFEQPVLGNANPNDIPVGSSALTDWTVGGTGGVTVNHVGSGYASLWPGNSSQWLDLTGSSGGANISQSFSTSIGTTYLVTLDTFNGSLNYNVNDPNGPQSHSFDMQATGGSLYQVNVTPGSGASVSYSFKATGTSTILSLYEATGYDSNAGWIDNVVVSAVPEPTTMFAGAGALGLALLEMGRARRSSVVQVGK